MILCLFLSDLHNGLLRCFILWSHWGMDRKRYVSVAAGGRELVEICRAVVLLPAFRKMGKRDSDKQTRPG